MKTTDALSQFMIDHNNKPIKPTTLQKLVIEFITRMQARELLPACFLPMGAGASTIGISLAAHWTAEVDPLLARFVCENSNQATERLCALNSVYKSPNFSSLYDFQAERLVEARFARNQRNNEAHAHTIFDSCFSYENCVVDREEGIQVVKTILKHWWPLSVNAALFGRAWKDTDPANRLAHDEKVATLKAGVNRDFNGYRIELLGVSPAIVTELFNEFGLQDQGAFLDNSIGVYCFDVELARPAAWYEQRRREDPSAFDINYRLNGLRM